MAAISITLTQNEIYAFLDTVGVVSIDYVEASPLGDKNGGVYAEWLSAGKQSLVNRDLMEVNTKGSAKLKDVLVAVVGSSLIPHATLLLTRVNCSGMQLTHYFHANSGLFVEQYSEFADTYTFDYLPDPGALNRRIRMLLSTLRSATQPLEPAMVSIQSSVLASCIENCQLDNLDAARGMVFGAGCSETIATSFIQDYFEYPSWVGVVGWGLREQEPAGSAGLIAVQGENRCWLIEHEPDGVDRVRIRQVSGPQCQQAFLDLLAPLFREYQRFQ